MYPHIQVYIFSVQRTAYMYIYTQAAYNMYSAICTESTVLYLAIPTLPYICSYSAPTFVMCYSAYYSYSIQTP